MRCGTSWSITPRLWIFAIQINHVFPLSDTCRFIAGNGSLSLLKIYDFTYLSSSYWLSNFYEPIHLTPFILNVFSFVFDSNLHRVIPHNFFLLYIFILFWKSSQKSFLTRILLHCRFYSLDSTPPSMSPSVVVFSFLQQLLYFYFGIKSLTLRLSLPNSFIFGWSKGFRFKCKKLFKLNLIT